MQNSPRPRVDRLRAVRTLLTVMLVLNVLYLIGAALARAIGGVVTDFDAPLDVVYGPQPFQLQQANRHLMPSMVDVYIRQPSLGQTLLGLLAHRLARGVATLPMVVFARRLVDRAIAADPFTMAMAAS